MRADGPLFVIQIENRRHRNYVHVRFVIGFERSDVPPVEGFLLVFIDEIVGVHTIVVDHLRQNVFAEVMARLRILGVLQQYRDQDIGVKQVHAHGCVNLGWIQV